MYVYSSCESGEEVLLDVEGSSDSLLEEIDGEEVMV